MAVLVLNRDAGSLRAEIDFAKVGLLRPGGSRPEAPPSMPSKTAERKTTELGSEKAM